MKPELNRYSSLKRLGESNGTSSLKAEHSTVPIRLSVVLCWVKRIIIKIAALLCCGTLQCRTTGHNTFHLGPYQKCQGSLHICEGHLNEARFQHESLILVLSASSHQAAT